MNGKVIQAFDAPIETQDTGAEQDAALNYIRLFVKYTIEHLVRG